MSLTTLIDKYSALMGGVNLRTMFNGGAVVWTIFDPASMFAASETGAWHDPSDLSTLFADDAATIPITTPGQRVAVMLDKSGNGKHFVQTNGTRRPYYRAGGGKAWLELGPGMWMDMAGDVNLMLPGNHIVSAGVEVVSVLSNGATPYLNAALFADNGGYIGMYFRSTGAVYWDLYPNTASNIVALATPSVLSGERSSGAITMRVNGVPGAANAATLSAAATTLKLGSNYNNTHQFNGNFFGAIIVGRQVTPRERTGIEVYLAAKTGATL